MDESMTRRVRERAGHACEYCRMPQAYYPTVPFPIDHIIARQHGGTTTLGNLALSCLHDNSHKGPNLTGIDPLTRKLTRLFHPMRHKWGFSRTFDDPRPPTHTEAPILTGFGSPALSMMSAVKVPAASSLLCLRRR